MELLSPVGNMEVLNSAINAGCDAVYLSGINFGARSFAGNFTNEQLKEAVSKCHIYGIKVYVTVNTIIYETEVDRFIKYIDYLVKINVDAVIMQDLGMIDLVRKTYPKLSIHASTQVNIHNIESVKFLEKLGVSRVVLARETPIELIKEIKENTNMEIEVFVHGALCMGYSGVCLMSALIGNRSGNRGTCAQICRQNYSLEINNSIKEKDKYLLSCKDLNTLNYIGKLIDIGVDSFKIEGRMKRSEYVYLTTSLYRKAINNYIQIGKTDISENDIKDLKKIFNREFTKGFLFSEDNDNYVNINRPNHIGIQIGEVIDYKNGYVYIKLSDNLNINDGIRILSNDDVGFIVTNMFINNKKSISGSRNQIVKIKLDNKVNIGSKVLKTTDYLLNEEIKNKSSITRKVYISGKCILKINNKVKLEITDGKNTVEILSENKIDKSINRPLSKEDIEKRLSKLGNTIFEFKNLDIIMDDNIFISIGELNKLRREAIEKLLNLRDYKYEYKREEYKIDVPNFKYENNNNILVNDYNDALNDKYKYIYVLNKTNNKGILRIPRINEYLNDYNEKLLVNDIGSIYKYKNVHTDFSLNVVNSYTVALLHSLGVEKITLSYELTYKQIKTLIDNYHKRYNKHPNLEVIIDSYPEAMVCKYNILKKYDKNDGYLIDRFNNKYRIKIKDNLMYIYHFKKVKKEENYFEIGINNVRTNLD